MLLCLKSTRGCVGCGQRGDSQSWFMHQAMHTTSEGWQGHRDSAENFLVFTYVHTPSKTLSVWGSRVHGFWQLYFALQKQVPEPHGREHLTLITCRHHTRCCFHFLSSWYFWRTWEAGSLHLCKHRFKKQRSLLHLPIFSGLRHANFLLRSRVSNVSSWFVSSLSGSTRFSAAHKPHLSQSHQIRNQLINWCH